MLSELSLVAEVLETRLSTPCSSCASIPDDELHLEYLIHLVCRNFRLTDNDPYQVRYEMLAITEYKMVQWTGRPVRLS